jgi:hypothetical protein
MAFIVSVVDGSVGLTGFDKLEEVIGTLTFEDEEDVTVEG